MKWQTMFKGDYLTAAEFAGRQPTFTISAVVPCMLEDDTGKMKQKGSVKLQESTRPWVLCKTTAMCLAAMFGDEANNWVGKRVTLFEDPNVRVGKEVVGGIRVLGSPDLPAPKSVSIKLPRKKAFVVTLQKTVPRAVTGAAPPASPPPPPPAPVVAPPPVTQAPTPVQSFVPPTPEELRAAEAGMASDGEF